MPLICLGFQKKMSVVEIVHHTARDRDFNRPVLGGLMDPRQGVIDRTGRCQTCAGSLNECPGHFGHVVLAKPVFNVLFMKKILMILRCMCTECCGLRIHRWDPRMRAIAERTKNDYRRRMELVYDLCKGRKRCQMIDLRAKEEEMDEVSKFV